MGLNSKGSHIKGTLQLSSDKDVIEVLIINQYHTSALELIASYKIGYLPSHISQASSINVLLLCVRVFICRISLSLPPLHTSRSNRHFFSTKTLYPSSITGFRIKRPFTLLLKVKRYPFTKSNFILGFG